MAKQKGIDEKNLEILSYIVSVIFKDILSLHPNVRDRLARIISKLSGNILNREDVVQILKDYAQSDKSLSARDRIILEKIADVIVKFRSLIPEKYIKRMFDIEDDVYNIADKMRRLRYTAEGIIDYGRIALNLKDFVSCKDIPLPLVKLTKQFLEYLKEVYHILYNDREKRDKLRAMLINFYIQSKTSPFFYSRRPAEDASRIFSEAVEFADQRLSAWRNIVLKFYRFINEPLDKVIQEMFSRDCKLFKKFVRDYLLKALDLIDKEHQTLYEIVDEIKKQKYKIIIERRTLSLKDAFAAYKVKLISLAVAASIFLIAGLIFAYIAYRKLYKRSPFSDGFIKGIKELVKFGALANVKHERELGRLVAGVISGMIIIGLFVLFVLMPMLIIVIIYRYYKLKGRIPEYDIYITRERER